MCICVSIPVCVCVLWVVCVCVCVVWGCSPLSSGGDAQRLGGGRVPDTAGADFSAGVAAHLAEITNAVRATGAASVRLHSASC